MNGSGRQFESSTDTGRFKVIPFDPLLHVEQMYAVFEQGRGHCKLISIYLTERSRIDFSYTAGF
jgi:hypothetical protein